MPLLTASFDISSSLITPFCRFAIIFCCFFAAISSLLAFIFDATPPLMFRISLSADDIMLPFRADAFATIITPFRADIRHYAIFTTLPLIFFFDKRRFAVDLCCLPCYYATLMSYAFDYY